MCIFVHILYICCPHILYKILLLFIYLSFKNLFTVFMSSLTSKYVFKKVHLLMMWVIKQMMSFHIHRHFSDARFVYQWEEWFWTIAHGKCFVCCKNPMLLWGQKNHSMFCDILECWHMSGQQWRRIRNFCVRVNTWEVCIFVICKCLKGHENVYVVVCSCVTFLFTALWLLFRTQVNS